MAIPFMRRQQSWKVHDKYEAKQLIAWGGKPSIPGCGEGCVCEFQDKERDEPVAIKRYRWVFDDLRFSEQILREIIILSELRHESILRMYDLIMPPNIDQFEEVYMVMEVCDSDLKRLVKTDVELTPLLVNTVFYNILAGLRYLHSVGICHCNLKPENCLVNQNCSVKLCGFSELRSLCGDRRFFRSKSTCDEDVPPVVPKVKRLMRSPCGFVPTTWYDPPELVVGDHQFTIAVDIWSGACIYAELLQMLPGIRFVDRSPLFYRHFSISCPRSLRQKKRAAHKCHSSIRGNQLDEIFDILGTPSDDDLDDIKEENLRSYIKSFEVRTGKGLSDRFAYLGAEEYRSIYLLEQMLNFRPTQRISAMEAIGHAIFTDIRDVPKEIVATRITPAQIRLPSFDHESGVDESMMRISLADQLQKFPSPAQEPELIITVYVVSVNDECISFLCTNIAGEELCTLDILVTEKLIGIEVRVQLAVRLETRLESIQVVLPCGHKLSDSDDLEAVISLLGKGGT